MLEKILLLKDKNKMKLRIKEIQWDKIIDNPQILHKLIFDLLLEKENLFYYTIQKESTKTLVDTKEYVRKLIDNNIINKNINEIFKTIGWDKDTLDLSNSTFQGDLAEYLMCILLDKITSLKTIIPKVSLKTSPKMPSFGNDNVFFDFDNNILYLGESKFYSDVSAALNASIKSMNKHESITEVSFIRTHTNVIKSFTRPKRAEIIEKMETLSIANITIKYVSFIINDDLYERSSYEEKILNSKKMNTANKEIVFVFLPIISKNGFLSYFGENLKYE